MSLVGVPLDIIKTFGRWKSDAVHLYVLDAPILTMAENLAKVLMEEIPKSYANFTDSRDSKIDKVFKKLACVDDIIRVWHPLPPESPPDDEVPSLIGIWMEGRCIATDTTTFTLNFEQNLQNIVVENEWSDTIRFPMQDGNSW